MKKKTFLSLTAASLLLASGIGVAAAVAHEEHGGHGMFQRIDSDASGGISLQEAQAAAMERMARFDANGDGTVTKAEMEAFAAERFAQVDTDGNGQVTHEEARSAMKAWREERRISGRAFRYPIAAWPRAADPP